MVKPLKLSDIDLAFYVPEQVTSLGTIFDRINKFERITVMAGPAGTGKTTMMKAVIEAAKSAKRRVIQMTPTGKAAVRLAEKTGVPCNTIHSSVYGGVVENEEGELQWVEPGVDAKRGDIIIIDEASMLGLRIFNDLLEAVPAGVSILFVGDNYQLSPVKDEESVYRNEPHVRLTQVHRQAKDNRILALATAFREGKGIQWLRENREELDDECDVSLGHGSDTLVVAATQAVLDKEDSIILCYTNHERRRINMEMRAMLGHRGMLQPGDRIICRTNNRQVGMMNGEIFTVRKMKFYNSKIWGKYMLVHLEDKKTPVRISVDKFGCERSTWWNWIKDKPKNFPANYIHADYAYAITIHSSQGSEWDKVFFWWDQTCTMLFSRDFTEANRLVYTALTRAAKKLRIHR